MNFTCEKKRQKSFNANKNSSNNHKDLICTVCNAPATGFNFSVITCMCCKAFFRRNALTGLKSLQCRYLSESCQISMNTRRDCSYCRLKKCFDVGMKKELILTDESKRLKREKILENRQATLNSTNQYPSLTNNDFAILTNIYQSYENHCRTPLLLFEKNEYETLSQQPIKSRIKVQHYFRYYDKYETSLINFFKMLPEFRQFTDEQQIALSQHNIKFLVRINLIEIIDDHLPIWAAINLLLEAMLGKSLLENINRSLRKHKDQINDTTCVCLLLIISLFSTYIDYKGDTDTLLLYRIQEKYIHLLWLYLVQNYDELTAKRKLMAITNYCLQLLRLGHISDLKKQEKQWQTFSLSLE